MNTIAASTRRAPRSAYIVIAVLVVAFAALMVVRSGVLDRSSSAVAPVASNPTSPATPSTPAKPVKPAVVLLPGLPAQVAAKLRYSKVVVVSVYLAPAVGDRAAAAEVRTGARAAGAGFVAVNVANDKNAKAMSSFVGPVSSPTMLVVRRPGKIVTQIPGAVEAAVVTQAAHNAGARRR